jgi:hypothetical protein
LYSTFEVVDASLFSSCGVLLELEFCSSRFARFSDCLLLLLSAQPTNDEGFQQSVAQRALRAQAGSLPAAVLERVPEILGLLSRDMPTKRQKVDRDQIMVMLGSDISQAEKIEGENVRVSQARMLSLSPSFFSLFPITHFHPE